MRLEAAEDRDTVTFSARVPRVLRERVAALALNAGVSIQNLGCEYQGAKQAKREQEEGSLF